MVQRRIWFTDEVWQKLNELSNRSKASLLDAIAKEVDNGETIGSRKFTQLLQQAWLSRPDRPNKWCAHHNYYDSCGMD